MGVGVQARRKRVRMRSLLQLIVVIGCAVGVGGQVAYAEEAKESTDPEADLPVYTADELVVTASREKIPTFSTVATRVPVPLRLTPASIGVVNHGLFEHQSGVVLGDALRNVSGVNVQTVFGVSDFYIIRGFDSLSSGLVLTDGVPEPEATFYHLYNLERVEVLKGPGAFLYGGNPLSGSVSLTRKQPIFRSRLKATGSYGPYGTARGTVDAGWADPDRGVAFRLNATQQASDGYREDKDSRIRAANPSVTWRNARTTVTANFEYVSSDYQSDSGLPVMGDRLPDVPRTRSYQSPFDASDQEIFRARVSLQSRVTRRVMLRNKLYFTDFSWLSQGTLFNGVFPNATGGLDVARSLLMLDDRQRILGDQFELELSFASGPATHTVLAGMELTRWDDTFALDAAALPSIDLYAPAETAIGLPPKIPGQSQAADSRRVVIAPYMMNRISLSESFHAFLGGRFDRIGYDDPMTATVRDYCRFSPMAGLVLSPAQDLSFYVNAGSAYAPPSTRVVGPREAEESRQVEAGVKKYTADNRLHATIAVYHLEKDHIGIPDATGVTKQEGDQRSRGIELEVMARPVKSWHTFLSYAYTDAELTRFAEMVPVMTATGVTYQHVDRSGNAPAFSPRHILNVWTAKGLDNGLELGVGLRYVSGHFIAEDNRYRIRDVLTFDASASYTHKWMKFQINARNLTDREYETRGFGSASVIPAHPFGLYGTCQVEL